MRVSLLLEHSVDIDDGLTTDAKQRPNQISHNVWMNTYTTLKLCMYWLYARSMDNPFLSITLLNASWLQL